MINSLLDDFLNYIYEEIDERIMEEEKESQELKEGLKELNMLYYKIKRELPEGERSLIDKYDVVKGDISSRRQDLIVSNSLIYFIELLKDLEIL